MNQIVLNSRSISPLVSIMLSQKFWLLNLFIFLITCPLLLNATPKVKKFNLMTASYPPYHFAHGNIKGLNNEIVIAAFDAVGYKVETQLMPFARALQYTKMGSADGMTLWHRQDREKWLAFSAPFTSSTLVFYKRKSLKVHFQTLKDIEPYTIGTVQQYAYPQGFKEAKHLDIEQVLNDEQNIKKLIAGRIDLALIDIRIAKYLIAKLYPNSTKLFDSAGVLKNEKFFLGISKNTINYQQKRKDFNRGLEIIKNNGVIDTILKKYN